MPLAKGKAMRLSEVYDTLQGAIWSELKAGGDIPAMRRNLQREHLRRVATALVKPTPATPADAAQLATTSAVAVGLALQVLRNSNGLSTMTGMTMAVLTGDESIAKPMSKIHPAFADCLPDLLKP